MPEPRKSKQELKEEAQFLESLDSRYREMLKLQGKELQAEKSLLAMQKARLEAKKEGMDAKEYEIKLNILNTEEKILGRGKAKRENVVKLLQEHESLSKSQDKFLKSQKKSIELEEILDTLGLGRLNRFVGLLKGMGTAEALAKVAFIGTLIYIARLAYNFQQIDKAAGGFRKTMGIIRADSGRLEKIVRDVNYNFAHIGATAEDVYKSVLAVTATLGSSNAVTTKMLETMTLLSAQLGVAESTSAEFLRVMGQVSRNTMDSQTNMALFTAKLSAAAGTNLNEVMGDIASASKTGYQFLSRDPLALAKAAVEAKKMGTNLESATHTASSLLNFTESVKNEMEASVLVGKSINLQKARELAYHRDIRGLNAEILNVMKQTNFENLDPFQQDAVARALGKSADELAKMAQADREMNAMRNSKDKSIKAEVAAYDKLVNSNRSMADATAKDYKAKLMALSNAESLKTITLAIHAIVQKGLYPLLPVIAGILKGIGWTLDFINNGMGMWAGWLGPIIDILDDIAIWFFTIKKPQLLIGLGNLMQNVFGVPLKLIEETVPKAREFLQLFEGLGKGGGMFAKLFGGLTKIPALFKTVSSSFSIFGKVFGFLKPFLGFGAALGKWITPIGWIITAVMFLVNLFKRLSGIGAAFHKGILQGIWFGIKAIGLALYDTLISPFVEVWKWLKKTFFGSSPSQLGLLIVKGIQAVGSMLIHMLLAPYISAWKLIKKIPFISHLFGGKNIAGAITPEAKATMNVTKNKPEVDVKKSSDALSNTVDNMHDELAKRISAIVDAINGLRDDMKNGKLTANVYIDSQKLDALMGRRLAYTGQLT
jgi:hypothetical protein